MFSGTGSVGKVAQDLGFNVISMELKMLILIVIYLNGTTNSLTETISILFG